MNESGTREEFSRNTQPISLRFYKMSIGKAEIMYERRHHPNDPSFSLTEKSPWRNARCLRH